MKSRIITVVISCLVTFAASGQDVRKEVQKVETKMDVFVSKTGTIIKFIDYKLSNLKLIYGFATTRIRTVVGTTESKYFYQIEKDGEYSSSIASIEYSDLIEVIKAIKTLKSDMDNDIALNPDYLENKFTTSDGFQVGYYVSKGKLRWYLKLEKYGSDNTLFIKDYDSVEFAFTNAKSKIDGIKN